MDTDESNIIITEKPDSISFEVIHNVLWKANEGNRKAGFILRTSQLSPEQLQNRIGEKGKCFVALDGDKVVGTISVRIINRNKWYYKGEMPDYMLAAVLPEYQGRHINSMLAKKVFEFAKKSGYKAIELDTAEGNVNAINVYKHQGFELVDYLSKTGLDHYSVVMVKWLEKCPYTEIKRKAVYSLRRAYIRTKYKK